LEDESGFVNAVVWESVFQRYSVWARSVSSWVSPEAAGRGVVHLFAKKLWEPILELTPTAVAKRDFH